MIKDNAYRLNQRYSVIHRLIVTQIDLKFVSEMQSRRIKELIAHA